MTTNHNGEEPFGGFNPKILTGQELDTLVSNPTYLVDRCVLAGQAGIIGGPEKALKTSISVDLGLSVAYGKPFLGKYDVLESGKVCMICCERGMPSLKVAQSVIAKQKGIKTLDHRILWIEESPSLDNEHHIEWLRDLITTRDIRLLMLDPFYWMIPETSKNSNNVYAMGRVAKTLITLARETECTIYGVAHFHKLQDDKTHRMPELSWNSGAGLRELCRQWILVNRRKKWIPGKRDPHNFWLNIGTQDGACEGLAVSICDGTYNNRSWRVAVQSVEDAQAQSNTEKEQKDAKKQSKLIEKIVISLGEKPDGMTVNAILKIVKGGKDTLENALSVAEEQGLTKQITVHVNGRPYKGWALV